MVKLVKDGNKVVLTHGNGPQVGQIMLAMDYSANGTEVETVLINGQIVMENKQILTFNEDEVKAKCEEISKRVLKELGR